MPSVLLFLETPVGLTADTSNHLWLALREVLWDYDPMWVEGTDKSLFRDQGWALELSGWTP